jgi:hypothetical protein
MSAGLLAVGSSAVLGIIGYVVTLSSLMVMTLIKDRISFYVRKAEINSICLNHRFNLLTKPDQLIMLCLRMSRTLMENLLTF